MLNRLISRTFGLIPAFLLIVLGACGGDSSSSNESNSGKVDEFEILEDLVHCSKSHYDELAYVVETDSFYKCTPAGWVTIDSTELEEILASSDSKSDGVSSAGAKSSSSVSTSAQDTAKVDIVKVDSANVSGWAQKGPMVSGSTVSVYGLDNSLARSTTKFTSKVTGDSGRFLVSGIVLKNQYAEIEVSGFYKNAFTGKNTSGTRTKLTALVDLSEGKSIKANVNLFTEFEKARALQLFKEKYNVPAAKVRASREILDAFNFTGRKVKPEDVPLATALSLADTGVAGIALYSAGLMMTANLTIGKSTSLIAKVAEDLAEDGTWDDSTTRASVADNLCRQDSVDGFEFARNSLKSMKLAFVVPDFESNLRRFWNEELGLGECTDKLEADEVVRKVSNKESAFYGAGFACTSKRWHKTTPLDAELGMCTSKMEGAYKESKLDKSTKYYTCKAGTWAEISNIRYQLGECTESLAADDSKKYKAVKDSFFLCRNNKWEALDEALFELKDCTDKLNKTIRVSEVDHESYVCDGGAWRFASDMESDLSNVCTSSLKGDTLQGASKAYYTCDGDNWTLVPSPYGDLGFCDKAAYEAYTRGIVNDTMWVCEENGWISTKDTAVYEAIGFCKKSRLYSVSGGYACVMTGSEYSWRKATEYEGKTGSVCNKSLSDKVVSKYVCEEKTSGVFEWRQATDAERATGFVCRDTKPEVVEGFVCDFVGQGKSWREATSTEKITGVACNFDIKYDVVGNYVCVDTTKSSGGKWGYYAWRVATAAEKATGRASEGCHIYEMVNGYTCADIGTSSPEFRWRATSDGEKATGTVCGCDSKKYPTNCKVKSDSTMSNGFACVQRINSSGRRVWGWQPLSDGEKDLGMMCTDAMKESLYAVKDTSKLYLCRAGWTLKQDNSSEAFSCTRDNVSYWHSIVANMAVMEKNMRVRVGTIEQNVNTWCGGNDEYKDNPNCPNYGRLYNYEAAVQVCPEGWHLPTKLEMNRIGKSYKSATNWKFQYAGYRDAAETKNSKYKDIDVKDYFWTSDNTPNDAYAMSFSSAGVTYMGNYSKEQGFAVRCIKDYTVISR